jgi:hypothetical protein
MLKAQILSGAPENITPGPPRVRRGRGSPRPCSGNASSTAAVKVGSGHWFSGGSSSSSSSQARTRTQRGAGRGAAAGLQRRPPTTAARLMVLATSWDCIVGGCGAIEADGCLQDQRSACVERSRAARWVDCCDVVAKNAIIKAE